MAEVKFCGLMRGDDAASAAALGAAYVGVIFAGGPRRLTASAARAVLDAATPFGRARRVGVFGDQSPAEIAAIAREAGLDVVQLHGASSPTVADAVRAEFTGEVWRVVRVRGGEDASVLRGGEDASVLRGAAIGVDAVVIDALVDGVLGGTGVTLDWERLATWLNGVGRPSRLVLAGGLRPDNVARAIGLVAPDVVDVSSGVESSVGFKNHELMRAFADAAARGGR